MRGIVTVVFSRGREYELRITAPGQSYAGLPMLRERLVALGDLAPDAPATTGYDGPLVDVRIGFDSVGDDADGLVPGNGVEAAVFVAKLGLFEAVLAVEHGRQVVALDAQ